MFPARSKRHANHFYCCSSFEPDFSGGRASPSLGFVRPASAEGRNDASSSSQLRIWRTLRRSITAERRTSPRTTIQAAPTAITVRRKLLKAISCVHHLPLSLPPSILLGLTPQSRILSVQIRSVQKFPQNLDFGALMEHLEQQATPLRVLEFYSGIGGMRYALEEAGVFAEVVEAFEINDTANDVYEHNFGHRPNQGNIQCLTVELLDKYKAHAWLLSPPCQPYTRQGLRKDVEDARAFSFLKILEILPHMSRPPAYLFIENVVGFECSATHNQLVAALEKAEFTMQEFILTPLQFGIPYSRPRYFCLAKKCTLSFLQPEFNGKLLYKPGPLLYSEGDLRPEVHSNVNGPFEHSSNKLIEPELDAVVSCRPILDYLEANVSCADEHVSVGRSSKSQLEDKEFNKHANKDDDSLRAGSSADVVNNKNLGGRPPVINTEADTIYSLYFWVSDALIERWGDAFDIVTPQSKKCCCFTKSYGRFVKGTGSFLATKNELHEGYKLEVSNAIELKDYLKQLGLRYFTPREVANLHSFPQEFSFPDHVSLKQRYALLGNSLSVAVVTYLLRYLFSTPNMDVSL